MKKWYLGFVLALFTLSSLAQDATVKKMKDESNKTIKKDAADTSSKLWKRGGLLGINLSQGSLTNWAAGGDNFSMSTNLYANVFAFYKKGKNSWDNSLDINLGYVNTTSLGARKNDDRIELISKYGYALNPKLNLTSLFNFRTQFFAGYDYPNANTSNLTSNLLAPAYLLFSLGLDYKPIPELSIFVSPLTSRWVIVNDDSLSAKGLYGVTPGKKSLNELGAYASITYTKNLNKIISYKGKLDLFSNYLRKPGNVDLFMTNIFSAKLSKVLSATWSLDFIYDDDVKLFGTNKNSPGLQIKSLLGVGFLVKM